MSIQKVQATRSRVGALSIVLVALAVAFGAMLWSNNAKADLGVSPTIASNPTSGNVAIGSTVVYTATAPHQTGAGTGTLSIALPTGVTITSSSCNTDAVGGTASNTSPSTSCSVGGTVTTAGTVTLIVNAEVTAANGATIQGATATASTSGGSSTAPATGTLTAVGATGTSTVIPIGGEGTVTITLPAGITYCSDPGAPGAARAFTAADQTVSGLTVVTTTPTTALNNVQGTHTVVVTDDATPGGSVTLSVKPVGGTAPADCTSVAVSVAAVDIDNVNLRHIDAFGDVIEQQDVVNNVRGARHVVCAVDETTDAGVIIPIDDQTDVIRESGGGYTSVSDPDPSFSDPFFFEQNVNDSPATCFSWVSTRAGDQEISATFTVNGVVETVDWDTDGEPSGLTNTSIIKQWNVLEDSEIFVGGCDDQRLVSQGGAIVSFDEPETCDWTGATSFGEDQDVVINRSISQLPTSGEYILSGGGLVIADIFHGSHVTNTGAVVDTRELEGLSQADGVIDGGVNGLIGVEWDVEVDVCGNDVGLDSDITYLAQDAEGNAIAGGFPAIYISSLASYGCLPGDSIVITFTGTEPGALGSGPGNTVEETVTINLVAAVSQKQVLLAWAGQRVILEHDWRIEPGDYPDLDNAGFCPLYSLGDDDAVISYVKGSGPGNFLPSLGASINGSDQATIAVQTGLFQTDADDQFEDAPNWPQEACISRVIFESEDPGEVDIEAFLDDEWTGFPVDIPDASKVAFVVYYMKLNTVNISLVTQAAKPTHNGSQLADWVFDAGNPWNAAADDADNAADWNVSADILVRGRVTGWFTNSNPSGRPADASDPLNVLPANRWVMPNDWPLLAGGPADPADGSDAIGTAEQLRPYYDLLFAPNNTANIKLSSPNGVALTRASQTLAGSTASVLKVHNPGEFSVGQTVYIETSLTTARTVTAVGPDSITISAALGAAPAAGTGIYTGNGVPFEGPYSLIDIPGLAAANGGIAGAALSNIPGDDNAATRDTVFPDGDVDMWDAPMPPAQVSISIRGAGFIKQVLKQDVYYTGTANSASQLFTNPFYISNIPDSPYIPAVVAGGGYLWNSWGNDGPASAGGIGSSVDDGLSGSGPYTFWQPVRIGTNAAGFGDPLLNSTAKAAELSAIREAYEDDTIARDLVVYTDNHGEFMVAANGDFNLTYDECATNTLGGGKLCAPGNKVGTSTISATADYPDFRGKHFPVASNTATVTWTWGGYKDVTIEAGEDPQIKYVVFHAVDRDGFCSVPTGAVSLHSVLTAYDDESPVGGNTSLGNQTELVDFLIDSDEGGIILGASLGGDISVTKEFATGVETFSTTANTTIKEFPNSPLAASADADECQAWVRLSNSLLAITNVMVVAHNDPPEGNVTFDRLVDFQGSASITLNFRWSLITWTGANNIPVDDAISGTGVNEPGNDISDQITAIYGWDAAAQDWLGYFPEGVGVPGANDLITLETGSAYWIAIKGPDSVTWTIATNVDQ